MYQFTQLISNSLIVRRAVINGSLPDANRYFHSRNFIRISRRIYQYFGIGLPLPFIGVFVSGMLAIQQANCCNPHFNATVQPKSGYVVSNVKSVLISFMAYVCLACDNEELVRRFEW